MTDRKTAQPPAAEPEAPAGEAPAVESLEYTSTDACGEDF